MEICKNFHIGITIIAKLSCIVLLIIQSALLDYMIMQLDKTAQSRNIWPVLDTIVALAWIIAMGSSYWYSTKPPQLEVHGWKKVLKVVMRELSFAHIYWLIYAGVLVAKIQRTFVFKRELNYNNNSVLSVTSFKIVLSLAGVMFPMLAYSREEVGHTERYRLLVRQLGTSASLDVLDSVMILDILFVVYNDPKNELTSAMNNTINTFSCLCLLLPVVPLFTLRIATTVLKSGNHKLFDFVMVINSILYLVLVNIPLLCIRIVLWARKDIDISTFFIKNVLGIVKGVMDIYTDIKVITKGSANEANANDVGLHVYDMPIVNADGDEVSLLNINDEMDYQTI